MPLFKEIAYNKHTKVLIWKIEESFAQLDTVPLKESSRDRVIGMKSDIHRRGFLSVRHLLQVAGYSDFDLYYSESGKPHLQDGTHISITHSFIFSAIVISTEKEVGIDIEKCRPKIEKIKEKFIHPQNDFMSNEKEMVDQLTVVWGIKESLYKIFPYKGLSFRKHIQIQPFKMSSKEVAAFIKKDEYELSYQAYFQKIEDFMLVYALPN